MDRNVIDITPGVGRPDAPQPFSTFADERNLVLLGDPGAGKSHLFQGAAAATGASYLTARSLLRRPTLPAGSVLFVDALDETRAGHGTRTAVDDVIRKLFDTRPDKVRLSCRVADWLGETDLAAFRDYFEPNGGVRVLGLRALARLEQQGVLVAAGVDVAEAAAFLDEVELRGLGDFALNPQNLLMLRQAVRDRSVWPGTRSELFELSTDMLLREHNKERSTSGPGAIPARELRLAAGAICAVRLLGDTDGFALQEDDALDLPGCGSVEPFPPDTLREALGRRVFVSGAHAGSVDYAHRTVAEYLAAGFMAQRVREGLPMGRIAALMGVDGHPTSELRGLNAWLAVLCPQHAERLIDADPYGVLAYGDAASLTPSGRRRLLRQLGALSERDPWFRTGGWESPALGTLAGPDMAADFRGILRSATAKPVLRSVVLDAMEAGPPMPELLPDLVGVLVDASRPHSERSNAAAALAALGISGRDALASFCSAGGRAVQSRDLRLRAEIIGLLYGDRFGADDVVDFLADVALSREDLSTAALWHLGAAVPEGDAPTILKALVVRGRPDGRGLRVRFRRRNRSQTAWMVEQLVTRCLDDVDHPPAAAEVIDWLCLWRVLRERRITRRERGVAARLAAMPTLLREVVLELCRGIPDGGMAAAQLIELGELTLFAAEGTHLAAWLTEAVQQAPRRSGRQALLFRMALTSCWSSEPWAGERFMGLCELVDLAPELRPVLEGAVSVPIPSWRTLEARRAADRANERRAGLERTSRALSRDLEAVRSGMHLDWLAWAAGLYFDDAKTEDHATSAEHLASLVGTDNARAALEGFVAVLHLDGLPTAEQVAASSLESRWLPWWRVLPAGCDVAWSQGAGLDALPDELWRTALAIQALHPEFRSRQNVSSVRGHGWLGAVLERRPDLARDAYLAVARASLSAGRPTVRGLHELLNEPRLSAHRQNAVLELLADFPLAPVDALEDMLRAALAMPDRVDAVTAVVRRALASGSVAGRQRELWLAAGLLLSHGEFRPALLERDGEPEPLIWAVRDLATGRHNHGIAHPLTVVQAEVFARLVAPSFPEQGPPGGVMHGDRNPWDGARFMHDIVSGLSANPDRTATQALERLASDVALASYGDRLRHALAQQRARRREAEFRQPDWREVVAVVANGRPANVRDLWALTAVQLEDLAVEIHSANTDVYKQYWNLDAHSRATSTRPEEPCRDALLAMLRPRLLAAGVTAEPEGHMVDDKRADIAVARPGMKVVVELKRDTHPEVWTAATGQLDRLYTRDPEARGLGILGVFWFGAQRIGVIPAPPGGGPAPRSPSEMADRLRGLLAEDARSRIAVVVFDVSAPGTGPDDTSTSPTAGASRAKLSRGRAKGKAR